MSYQKILIAVDNSAYSMNAAKKGFELAHQLNAIIGLIYVIDRNKESVSVEGGITLEQSQTVLLQQAEENISQLIKMYDGVEEVMRFTPEGYPKKEVINTAKEWRADLIVMGTHGRTGLTHLLIGSVAEYVIKHAGIPVMVISSK